MNVEPRPKSGAARKRRRTSSIPGPIRVAVRTRSNGWCEVAHLIGCGPARHPSQHLHHVKMRSQGGDHTVDNLLAVCHTGHDLIHRNPAISYELGLLARGVS